MKEEWKQSKFCMFSSQTEKEDRDKVEEDIEDFKDFTYFPFKIRRA